eukprot:CAMPEP_0118928404 /NCGR_PEP_ID=MMETSP1169-20130426/5659_1 /TAXON_ID=36882 /ORGANISM="Pyramimonas obovata, Strain CCMP722" /LENGTH=450 /DNA_ID=CAMNT_0006870359 /DNA_START=62 /DNA_END=1414 /DNA_ORIENTATION=-
MPYHAVTLSPALSTAGSSSSSALGTRQHHRARVPSLRPAWRFKASLPPLTPHTLTATRSRSQHSLLVFSHLANVRVRPSRCVRANATDKPEKEPMIIAEPLDTADASPSQPAAPKEPAASEKTAAPKEPASVVSEETAKTIVEAVKAETPKNTATGGFAGSVYNVLLLTFAVTSAAMLLAPGILLEYMQVPFTAATPLFLRVLGAVQLYGVTASYVLKEAADNDRMGSNTYKRLNLGMIANAMGMMAFKATAEQAWAAAGLALSTPYMVWGSLVSLALIMPLYIYTESESETPLAQIPTVLVAGAIDFPKALLKSANNISKAYASLTVLSIASAAIMIYAPFGSMQMFFKVALDTACVLDTLLIQSIACNLLLFAAALFALQDAANRDRLAASTFRALNLTLAVKGACLALAYLAAVATGLGTAVTAVDGLLQGALGGFGAYCFTTFKKK